MRDGWGVRVTTGFMIDTEVRYVLTGQGMGGGGVQQCMATVVYNSVWHSTERYCVCVLVYPTE